VASNGIVAAENKRLCADIIRACCWCIMVLEKRVEELTKAKADILCCTSCLVVQRSPKQKRKCQR
jgi:hypothetical protein